MTSHKFQPNGSRCLTNHIKNIVTSAQSETGMFINISLTISKSLSACHCKILIENSCNCGRPWIEKKRIAIFNFIQYISFTYIWMSIHTLSMTQKVLFLGCNKSFSSLFIIYRSHHFQFRNCFFIGVTTPWLTACKNCDLHPRSGEGDIMFVSVIRACCSKWYCAHNKFLRYPHV